MKYGLQVEVDEWCTTVCSMTRSKFKVTSPSMSETRPFQKLSPPPFTMGAGNWPRILKLVHNIWIWPGRIFNIPLSFCHETLNLAETSVAKNRPSVPYDANFYTFYHHFSSPRRAVSPLCICICVCVCVCVCVCLSLNNITLQLNDLLWVKYLARWFRLTLSRSNS